MKIISYTKLATLKKGDTKMIDKLKTEYDYFLTELDYLLSDKEKRGKVALIKGKKIQGIYKDMNEAIYIAMQKKGYKLSTFLVQKIEKQFVHHLSRVC